MTTQQRKMVKGLAYESISSLRLPSFFERVDELGGWPVGYMYVGFEHTLERKAGFTNSPRNDGWWTVLASTDDYYFWKISDVGKQKIVDRIVRSSRVVSPKAGHIFNLGAEL